MYQNWGLVDVKRCYICFRKYRCYHVSTKKHVETKELWNNAKMSFGTSPASTQRCWRSKYQDSEIVHGCSVRYWNLRSQIKWSHYLLLSVPLCWMYIFVAWGPLLLFIQICVISNPHHNGSGIALYWCFNSPKFIGVSSPFFLRSPRLMAKSRWISRICWWSTQVPWLFTRKTLDVYLNTVIFCQNLCIFQLYQPQPLKKWMLWCCRVSRTGDDSSGSTICCPHVWCFIVFPVSTWKTQQVGG